jgi:4-hydroxy-tetrahydrodipicolinate synthase
MGGQMRPEMAIRHFETIASATSLPIILFQYPLGPGLGYPIDTLLEICRRVPQIRAIKDWCNDAALHERHIRELRSLDIPVNILSTHSAWLLSSLVQGCDGLLSGAGSVIANLQVALFRAFKTGDLTEARRINDMIYPTVRAFYDAPFLDMHNRMKEALFYLGRLPEAHVRPPLMKLHKDEISKIQNCMDSAGLTSENVYQKVA